MNLKKYRPLFVVLGAGILGFFWRVLLYRTGFDDRGILSASQPLHLGCLILTALVALFLALKAKTFPDAPQDLPRFRLPLGLTAGCCLLVQALRLCRRISGPLVLLQCALTAAAAVAMVVCALPLKKSRSLASGCHGLICIGFAADMLGRYQGWSGNPQLPDYVFHVLAGVALSLTAYQTLALHTGLGSPKWQKFWGLWGIFLSLLCLAGPVPGEFYLGGACWTIVCLMTTLPPAEDVPQEDADVSA